MRPTRTASTLQHHWGVYRSDDAAAMWQPHEGGLPSTFSMPLLAHPHRGGTAWVIPLQSDEFRCTPEGWLRLDALVAKLFGTKGLSPS